ncbi:MAG: hypothetical protein Fur0022_00660 [Anaerolineales bacterium]
MYKAMPITESLTNWLLAQAEPWVVLNTRIDLLGQGADAPEVQAAYKALRQHELVADLLAALKVWPQEQRIGKAYDPKDSLWKLAMLADFGLKRDDERIATISEKVLELQAEDPYPPGFLHGGMDHTKSWDKRPYICISHVMTYALACFGYLDDPRLQAAYDYIEGWQRLDGGWHPNKKNLPNGEFAEDPSCPFGTVNVLRALAANPPMRENKISDLLAEARQTTGHPLPTMGYYFDLGMKPTHKAEIVAAYEQGLDEAEVAARSQHAQSSVGRYLRDYERVKLALQNHLPEPHIPSLLGMQPAVVRAYLALVTQYHPTLRPAETAPPPAP